MFARLHEMTVGDSAAVTRSDGTSVRFTAYRVERFSKSAFPTEEVYGNTEGPELRLVTCGGDFDRAAHSYRDNVVVFARTGLEPQDTDERSGDRHPAPAPRVRPAGQRARRPVAHHRLAAAEVQVGPAEQGQGQPGGGQRVRSGSRARRTAPSGA